MEVDDRTRLKLHRRLDEVLGQEEADALMAHLPPVTWQEVATTRDLDAHGAELRSEIRRLDAKIDAKIEALDSKFEGKLDALDSKIDGVESRLRGEIHQAITHQTRWMAGFVAGFVSLWSGVVLGLARLIF